ncbi:MAG: hypothetical protein J6C15_07220 [Bacteroidaceae bacterium]|nr:hypothetical protein [Bacteroidaceae bacterium]
MRKITFLMTLLLAVFTTAMAQIDTSKEYRVKYVASNIYLNASNYEAHPTGPLGGVNFVEKAESDDQIFTFEANGTGYSLKSKSGKYIYCQAWNVDALDTPSVLTFKDAGNGEYYIMNGANYFKVEYVTGNPVATVEGTQITRESVSGYFPYCDATTATAKFALEEVEGAVEPEPEPEPTYQVITSVDQLSNSKCYTIVSSDTGRGGMYALAGKVDMCGVTYSAGSDACHSVARNAEDPAQQFAFVEYEGKHYLYSVSQKKFVAKEGDVNKLTAEGPFSYVTVGKVGDNTFSLMIDDANYMTASPGWCSNPSRGTCIQTTLTAQVESEGWDAGAWFTITEAGEFDAAEALAMLAPAEPLAVVSVNPACGHYNEGLPAQVVLEFNAAIQSVGFAMLRTDFTGVRGYVFSESDYVIGENKLTLNLPAEYITNASQAIISLEVLDANGNAVTYAANDEDLSEGYITLSYTAPVKANIFEMVAAEPAAGVVEKLDAVKVTFQGVGNTGFVGGFDNTKVVEVRDAKGTQVATATMAVVEEEFTEEGETYTFPTASVLFTLNQPITAAGEYTLVIPEGTVYNEGYAPDAEDLGVAWGAIYNPAIEVKYTIEAKEEPEVTAADLRLTFERNGADVTVKVAGLEGVTATLVEKSHDFKNLNVANANTILCPDINATAEQTITMTFQVDGLPANLNLKNVNLDIHALNGAGNYQDNADNKLRQWNVVVAQGEEVVTTFADIEISQGTEEGRSSSNNHKVHESGDLEGPAATNPMMLKLTITKGTTNGGCFFGLGEIALNYKAKEEVVVPTALEMVGSQPENGSKVEQLSVFTVTFNKELKSVDPQNMGLLYGGMNPVPTEVQVSVTDPKSITVTLQEPYSLAGEYVYYMAAGTITAVDETTNEGDIMIGYTIEAAPNSFGNVYAAPASGSTVETLKSVTMGFMSEVASVKSDAINVTDADGNLATTATLAADDMDFNAVVVTLAEEVTKAGTYTIVVPEGFITSVSGTYNPELTLTYTIEAPAYDVKPVIEAAQAVINVRGVGYPTVESAAYLAVADAIAAAEKTPSEEAGKAIEDAVAAYKAATEGIQLPEDGKYYSITVVAKNGDKFFYNYADAKIDLAKGEEIPTTSAFLCTANKDGSYTFTTQDGKYLIYRNADKVAAWGDWTKNYITGVIDENDEELTKITIAKMKNGGQVAAASQADLFGFVTWQSVRGLKNGTPEVGYVVVSTANAVFDGANAPFFNDNFSSAMLFQEVAIASNTLEPVSVEPAEPYFWETMEDIETIAINFPEEVTYDETKPVTVTYNSTENVEVTVAVNAEDAKQLVVTFPENLKLGEYVVNVPEGAVVAANGSYNPALSYTYNVWYAFNTFEPTSITPAAGEVESLKTIVLDFGPNDYPGTNGIDQETAIEVKNAMGDVVTTGKLSFHGYTGAAVTLESEITAAGLYYVIIPEGMIWNSKYENTEEKGVSKGARCNPSIELAYTIGEGATVTEVTPAPGYFEEGVPTEIAVTFSKEIKTVNFLILRTNAFGRGSYLTEDNYTIEGNKLNIKLPAEEVKYVPNATVQIQVFDVDGFPVTYAADESEVNEGFIMLTYTAPTINSLFAMASVDPAEGEVTELSTLNVTFENLQGGNDMGMGAGYVGGFDESKVVEVLDADGKQVATASMEVVMNVYREEWEGEVYEFENPTATVKFTLSQAITAAGTYTFVIPEATVYNEGFYPESEDFGVSLGAIYNPEIRLTYTIQAPSGISGVEVEAAKGNVYNLQGVRVANKLQKGVYIVNGKKVYVK